MPVLGSTPEAGRYVSKGRGSIVILILAHLLSCNGSSPLSDSNTVKGNGIIKTQTRTLPDFTSLNIDGALNVTGTLGDQSEIVLKGDSKILEIIETSVHNGTLTIRPTKSYANANPPELSLTSKRLTELSTNGSADVTLMGLNSVTFGAKISGSSTVKLAGQVGGFEMTINGSGDVDAKNFTAEKALVTVNGSGRALVNVKQALRAEINGSGKIQYRGNPSLSQSLKGSGSLNKVE